MARLLMNLSIGHRITDIAVIAPDYALSLEKNGLDRSKKLPVLWLLHDYGGDCNDWTRFGNVELIAEKLNAFIVLPAGAVGYWVDSGAYMDYETITMNDVWDFIMRTFPVSDKREDNFIAGKGMGGYAAIRFALKTGRFAAAASFDGDLSAPQRFGSGSRERFQNPHIFENPDGDFCLFSLAKQCTNKPALWIACGKDSKDHDANIKYRDFLTESSFGEFTWHEDEFSGWEFCSSELKAFIASIL